MAKPKPKKRQLESQRVAMTKKISRAGDPEKRRELAESLRKLRKEIKKADEALRQSGLDYTIVRPGRLTNDPGSRHVRLALRLRAGGGHKNGDRRPNSVSHGSLKICLSAVAGKHGLWTVYQNSPSLQRLEVVNEEHKIEYTICFCCICSS